MSQPAPVSKDRNAFSRRYNMPEDSRKARDKNLEAKREEAKGKVYDYSHKTPEERLAVLDAKLGKGVGARKERARLEAMVAAEQIATQ
ncbi:MAG: hypothetical protein HZA36_01260 [Parcubacteria group bacterium]|nr:hypothetical protein [Parcubacteria group bacterium]